MQGTRHAHGADPACVCGWVRAVHSKAGMALNLPPLASLAGDEAHIDRVELDPASYLAHRLSPAERQQFEDDGVTTPALHLCLPRAPSSPVSPSACLPRSFWVSLATRCQLLKRPVVTGRVAVCRGAGRAVWSPHV